MHWRLWGASHLGLAKPVNCNQILGHVADQDCIEFIDSINLIVQNLLLQESFVLMFLRWLMDRFCAQTIVLVQLCISSAILDINYKAHPVWRAWPQDNGMEISHIARVIQIVHYRPQTKFGAR